MFARRSTFLLTIPTLAPDLPSDGEAPQVDHIALHTFPTKHVVLYSTNNIIGPTSVGVNTFSTGVKHVVPNVQAHIEWQKRSKDANSKN